jgi:hypothetical protein
MFERSWKQLCLMLKMCSEKVKDFYRKSDDNSMNEITASCIYVFVRFLGHQHGRPRITETDNLRGKYPI